MGIKEAILIVFALCITTNIFSTSSVKDTKTSLSGKIIDKYTGTPLAGVSVYIPDLKTGTISNPDGTYEITNLPLAKVMVHVQFIGYKMISVIIDLSFTTTMDFTLEESVSELNEIVITGLSGSVEKNRTPSPITTIPSIELSQGSATNIIDAISKEPGLSQITTGAGISKPVIRGLGFNRVVTIHEGIRQEGQQWGDEHGIEIDEYSVDKVEILKGPASLTYGSDAMAGVIHLISNPTLPSGSVKGNLTANYQSNNGLFGYTANLAGNQNGFIWDMRYSNKRAHAYRNKLDGYVFNSGFKENSASGKIGLNKSWGYSHLSFSVYQLTPGIVEGERDSLTGHFTRLIALNDSTESVILTTDEEYKSYTPFLPYQKVHHTKAVLNNSFILGDGSLKAIIGWQQNKRQEFSNIFAEDQYGLYFLLNTLNYDLRYLLEFRKTFNISVGMNGMQQASQNQGSEFLIPEYDLFDFGIFGIVSKNVNQLDITAGIRFDSRNETGDDLYLNSAGEITTPENPEAIHQFKAFNTTFNGISGSIGGTYQFSDSIFSKLNFSRGFRAPNISELSSNGRHEGTINYIIGDPELKPEHSLQIDFAFGVNTNHVTGELSLFTNHIENYIFLSKLESIFGGDSIRDNVSTLKYTSGDAVLSGGEISVDIHPHPWDWIHFENSFSYVSSIQKGQPDSTKFLPFTPAPRWISEIRLSSENIGKGLRNAYLSFSLENYFKQNKIYEAFNTETGTPGYILLNMGVGTDVVLKGSPLFSIYLNVNNIADTAYQSHLSRLKYAPVNHVTGRAGVYNMGRNVSIKIIASLGV